MHGGDIAQPGPGIGGLEGSVGHIRAEDGKGGVELRIRGVEPGPALGDQCDEHGDDGDDRGIDQERAPHRSSARSLLARIHMIHTRTLAVP